MSNIIKLPKVLTDFVIAQNEYNSSAYADNFADDAVVHDEGKDYHGRSEIKRWNETTNEKYHTRLEPIEFLNTEKESILTVMVFGTFDGSPLPLKYHFAIKDNKITSLRVTDK